MPLFNAFLHVYVVFDVHHTAKTGKRRRQDSYPSVEPAFGTLNIAAAPAVPYYARQVAGVQDLTRHNRGSWAGCAVSTAITTDDILPSVLSNHRDAILL